MAPTASIDETVLRTIQGTLADWPEIDRAAFEPSYDDPRLLRAIPDGALYPATVVEARLDVRWFRNGDFSIHYVESWRDGTRRECRWDRHENPHGDRLHFHPLPDAGGATGLDPPTDARDLVPAVVQWSVERGDSLYDRE